MLASASFQCTLCMHCCCLRADKFKIPIRGEATLFLWCTELSSWMGDPSFGAGPGRSRAILLTSMLEILNGPTRLMRKGHFLFLTSNFLLLTSMFVCWHLCVHAWVHPCVHPSV